MSVIPRKATETKRGLTQLSVAPAVAGVPKAVGDNDPRMPSSAPGTAAYRSSVEFADAIHTHTADEITAPGSDTYILYNSSGAIASDTGLRYVATNALLGIGGTPTARIDIQGNVSSAAWTSSGIALKVRAATYTDTSSSGTVANHWMNVLDAATLVASSATTYTQAATLVLRPPVASTNVTITSNYALICTSGDTALGGRVVIGANAGTLVARLALTGSTSAAAWGVAGAGLRIAAGTYTDTSSSGTVASNAVHGIATPVLTASSSTTYTDASTLYIGGPPTASTNVVITNNYAVYVASGNMTLLSGSLGIGAAVESISQLFVSRLLSTAAATSYGIRTTSAMTWTANQGTTVYGGGFTSTATTSTFNASAALTSGGGCIGVLAHANVAGGASGTVTAASGVVSRVSKSGANTLTTGCAFLVIAGTGGAGTWTDNIGYDTVDLTLGTNIYAFRGRISSAATKWNLYCDGTAQNYLRGNLGIGSAPTAPTAAIDVDSDVIRLRTAKTPASASATGNSGDICWDASYLYVCTAANTWKRVAIATWP
jgi:hypothetical protein